MNDNASDILVIDDDDDYCALVRSVFANDFICASANTGEAGIQVFKQAKPKLVLLDLGLPEACGFDISQQLKQQFSDRDFAIFVVTGDDSLSTKLKAFEVGADDFITKPFELKELHSRVMRSINYIKAREALKQQHDDSQKVANISMMQASQYSYVMNFFKLLNSCEDQASIVRLFFEAMTFFKLHASIAIRVPDAQYFDVNLLDVCPIEKNIYELLHDKGRLYEFGARLMVNSDNVSFLVKNLPADADAAGQARDFLASLIEGLESAITDLQRRTGILSAVSDLSVTIRDIREGVHQHNEMIRQVMSNMLTQISASYHSLDLTEEQEAFFTQLIENGAKQMGGAEKLLSHVQWRLEDLRESMESLQFNSTDNPGSSQGLNNDIELF